MNLLNHDLAHEFPGYLEKINQLKAGNAHFSSLAARYDAHNHLITRHEQGHEPMAEMALEVLKKERLEFKDEIYQQLKAA